VIIAGREFVISVYRTFVASKGVSIPASQMAKWKTLFQQLAVGFALWPWFAVDAKWVWVSLLWAAVVLAVVSGIQYLWYSRVTELAALAEQTGWGAERGALMRCDVLAVGTELLLGQIIDSNSAWMGEQLAAHGFDSLVQVKVGDNVGRISTMLRRMLADADAVIMCGGLGPTHDDLTREAIAAVMGVELVLDEAVADTIREMFASRGRRMPENNLRQAMVPVGATIIPQTRGTAPGLICPVTVDGVDKVVFAVPGVPHELYDMFARGIIPELQRRDGERFVIASRVLRTWGESESGLNERLDDVIAELDAVGNPTLAFLASGWEGLKVRLTAKADRSRGAPPSSPRGRHVCVPSSTTSSSASTATRWSRSCSTCSVRRAGRSAWPSRSPAGWWAPGSPGCPGRARCSVVRSCRTPPRSSSRSSACRPGPSSPKSAALEMARGARRVLGCDVALALTGVAGPGEQDGMPAGTLCVGLVWPDGELTRTLRLPGQREQMRQFSVISSLDLLRRTLT
jgi:nicotinamide-nucleotide amidase